MMRWRWLLLGILALAASALPARAQTLTTVTGTVTDPNGLPYAGARLAPSLISPGGRSPELTPCANPNAGCQIQNPGPVTLDGTGSFTINLWANASILPAGTTYSFQVTLSPGQAPPLGTGPQTFTLAGVTIAGASQSLSATLSAAAPVLTRIGAATTNLPAIGAFNVKNYGALGGAQMSRNCSFSNVSGVVTSTGSPWTPAVVGKKFQGVLGANATSEYGTVGGGAQNNEVTVTGYTNAGSITVSSNAATTGTGMCVWYAQQDDVPMRAAQAAASTSLTHMVPGYNSPTLAYTATVYIPPDGYVACGAIFTDTLAGATSTQGVSLIGQFPVIYVAPCFLRPYAGSNRGTLIASLGTSNLEVGNLIIEGMGFQNTNVSNQSLVGFTQNSDIHVHDILLNDWGTNGGGGVAAFSVFTNRFSTFENIFVQNSPTQDNGYACIFTDASSNVLVINMFCSNHKLNWNIVNSGARDSLAGGGLTFYGVGGDECGQVGSLACWIQVNSTVNVVGGLLFNPGGGTASVSLDTTSIFYGTDINVSSYGSDPGNSHAFLLAGNAQLFLTSSDVAGNNTGSAVNGPSTATFASLGGNKLFNQAAGVRTLCTAATQTTAACGWSGGIQPKSTETHAPNTCYAVTGNLLATAQNLCTYLLDQNYQLVNITAQSGGTTPTNSSCTGAPVVTISDGTRSGTLTMTTGKTQWSSAVDSATVNTVFAAGTTLTTSIGANTCATPPVNVSVNMILQSVLNF